MVEQWNTVVKQCGTVWWNTATVEQCGGTLEQWNSVVEERSSVDSVVEH